MANKTITTTITVLLWTLSLLTIALGILICFSASVFAGVLFILAGVQLVPPYARWLGRKVKAAAWLRALAYLLLVAAAVVALPGKSKSQVDQEQLAPKAEEPKPKAEQQKETKKEAEWQLKGATLNVYVVAADQIDALRQVAYERGKDGNALYPADGAIALIEMPLQRVNFRELEQIFPLICEVTVLKKPDYWRGFADVRIVNAKRYNGFAYGDNFVSFVDACSSGDIFGSRVVIGKWEVSALLDLAKHSWNIGYGDNKVIGESEVNTR